MFCNGSHVWSTRMVQVFRRRKLKNIYRYVHMLNFLVIAIFSTNGIPVWPNLLELLLWNKIYSYINIYFNLLNCSLLSCIMRLGIKLVYNWNRVMTVRLGWIFFSLVSKMIFFIEINIIYIHVIGQIIRRNIWKMCYRKFINM